MPEPSTPFRLAARFAGRAAVTLVLTLAVLFVLLLGAFALPGGPVRANIARSVPLLQAEGLYPRVFRLQAVPDGQLHRHRDAV